MNIWDLGKKINIKVKKEFIGLINKRIKEEFRTKRRVYTELIKFYHISFSTFKDRMKRSYKYFIDLEILLNLCKLLDIPLDELQNNILAYKTRRGHNYIENPKLPVEITPLFDMLVAHHIADGNVVNPKNGRKPYFSYRQYDEKYRRLYIKKIESVFGKLNHNNSYLNDKKITKIYFPVPCSELMFNLYNMDINSFKSKNARIPKEIFKKNWKHKLAFLLGIIIDDGSVDSSLIVIRLKNRELIKDLQKICIQLNYSTSFREAKDKLFCLYILSKSLNKLYQEYNCLLGEYPEVNLGYKGQKIKEFINRINKPKRYIKGNKEKLLLELSKGDLTVNELALKLNMTRQGARYLIKELAKEDKIKVKSVVKYATYKYGLR